MHSKTNGYDVIVIGGGIAGLTCAASLSKYGKRVILLESHDKVGGCCSSFEKAGFKFDVGSHIFGACGERGLLGRILRELGAKVSFIKRDLADRIIFPDEIINIPPDLDEYKTILQKKFPKEKVDIEKFFKEIIRLFRKSLSWEVPVKQRNLSFQDLVDTFFTDYRLKAIVSGLYGYLGEAPNKISAVSLASLLVVFIRDGTYYPVGGAQALPDALVQCIEDFGGEVSLSTPVSKIITKENRIIGIETKDGEFLKSKVVISNIDADTTFNKLLSDFRDGRIKQKIKKLKKSMSLFVMYLGTEDQNDMYRKKGMYHTTYDLNNKKNHSYYIHIPTLFDKSLAPPGKHIIIPQYIFPYKYEAVKDWKKCKEELQEWMLLELEKIFPRFRNSIVVSESATPLTIERYTGNSNGSVYGWALSPQQVFSGRLGNKTTINGLYLTGHWTNPGPGVPSVAASGWHTAKEVIQNLEKLV